MFNLPFLHVVSIFELWANGISIGNYSIWPAGLCTLMVQLCDTRPMRVKCKSVGTLNSSELLSLNPELWLRWLWFVYLCEFVNICEGRMNGDEQVLTSHVAGQRGCFAEGAVHDKTSSDSAGVPPLQPHKC
jgi:hypothetical protein